MKFFTLGWYNRPVDSCNPLGPDAETVSAWQSYESHLKAMEGRLPPDLLVLARLDGFHDCLVILVLHDRERRVLTLTLRAGDLQMGYYDLVLRYEGAEISPEHEQVLARIARTTRSECRHESDACWHELDRAEDGRLEHRMLFHPGVWFAVRCETLSWEQRPRPNRRLPRRRGRFPGGPATPVDVSTTLPGG